MNYKQREVVLIPFPYTDQTQSKKRPALVVSANWYNSKRRDLILVPITGKIRNSPERDEVVIGDSLINQAGLIKVSTCKCGRPVTMDQALVTKVIGTIPEGFFKTVLNKLIAAVSDHP